MGGCPGLAVLAVIIESAQIVAKLAAVPIFYKPTDKTIMIYWEKDGGTKNCIYKDLWSGTQGLVSAY